MQTIAQGTISKMKSQLGDPVQYHLPIGEDLVDMNALIGKTLSLAFNSEIYCQNCERKIKKSYSQGFCYPCMLKLAQCDSCILKPEKCHYDQGTCREPEWGETHCLIDHIVYLANSSGLKVGITRNTQVPTRWIDQGALQAVPMLRVHNRHTSGLAEVLFKQYVGDKTNGRKMLKNEVEEKDLLTERERLLSEVSKELEALSQQLGEGAIEILDSPEVVQISYPVVEYPEKIKSFNLDKTPEISGKLMGIKGQYLLFDTGVINLRKYTSYHIALSAA